MVLWQPDHRAWLLSGVVMMLELAIFSWLLAMGIGVVLAGLRASTSRLAQWLVAVYVEYHQNVPVLVQIFLWYFGVPMLLPQVAQDWLNANGGEFLMAFTAIGVAVGAYFSEDLRGGIRSVPKAQMEAARSLGLSYVQAARKVLLPQAFRNALPALVNHSVLLFKSTSLAMTVGVAELTYVAREIENKTFKTVEVYLFATLVYMAVSLLIMWLGQAQERRWRARESKTCAN